MSLFPALLNRVGWHVVLLLFGLTRIFAADSQISNFAGTGVKGFSGDGGPATEALLNGPTGVALGPDRALYICDTANHRIRKVTPEGIITTFAGNGRAGWAGDGGPAIEATLNEPYEVRFSSQGDAFWVERLSHTVRKCDRTGRVSTVAGNGKSGFSGDGGPATAAQLNEPHSIGFGGNDDLYICDVRNHRIRKVVLSTGVITTFSGIGKPGPVEDGHPISGAVLNGPRALDFDPSGDLWVALREGNAILRLSARDGVHRIAGTGQKGFTGDGGPGLNASMAGPKGISIGPEGECYFADTENNAIRAIDPRTKIIRLVAGTGTRGDGTESDPLKCALARPHGIFVDKQGSIYIGDTDANRVRVIRAAD